MPKVLVTGASSGIGLATVEEVAARGADVVATVRRTEDADMVRERQRRLGHPVATDLLDLTDAARIDEVIGFHRPDVIVNVAGDAAFGLVLDADPEQVDQLLDQHLVGPMRLARAAAPHLRRSGEGRIVNVGSSLARTAVPMTGWYSATKAALASLTESLRIELADDGVAVVFVELGAVDTPAWDEATAGDGPTGRRWARTTRLVRPLFPAAPEAARTIARAALDPDPRVTYRAGFGASLLAATGHAPPRLRQRALDLLFSGPPG